MINELGLQTTDIANISEVLKEHPEVNTGIVFGSRAKGNYKNGSDIDLALKGKLLNTGIVSKISYRLNEETRMPYKFDVLNYHTIQNIALVEHIDRVGKEIYRCKNEV